VKRWPESGVQVATVNDKKHYCIPPPWAWDPVKNRIPAYKTTHALGFPLRSQLLLPSFTWAAVGFPAVRLLRPPHFVLLAGHSTGGIYHMNASGHQFRVISRGGSLLLPPLLSQLLRHKTNTWLSILSTASTRPYSLRDSTTYNLLIHDISFRNFDVTFDCNINN
jgi:hypothetical protein